MTNARSCTYEGDRDERIVACLYGELESGERARFESHVATCAACREELAALGAVRGQLSQWMVPDPAFPIAPVQHEMFDSKVRPARARVMALLAEIPAWTQVAAALLFLGVAAGIAHLDISYDQRGLSVRTGWSRQESTAEQAGAAAAAIQVPVSMRPWRADLDNLERQLRAEFLMTAAPQTASGARAVEPAVNEAALVRSVRPLIEESERRQERELALRLAETARDVEVQRRSDLEKINYLIQGHMGAVQDTGAEVMRQRRMINDLAVRVAQRP